MRATACGTRKEVVPSCAPGRCTGVLVSNLPACSVMLLSSALCLARVRQPRRLPQAGVQLVWGLMSSPGRVYVYHEMSRLIARVRGVFFVFASASGRLRTPELPTSAPARGSELPAGVVEACVLVVLRRGGRHPRCSWPLPLHSACDRVGVVALCAWVVAVCGLAPVAAPAALWHTQVTLGLWV